MVFKFHHPSYFVTAQQENIMKHIEDVVGTAAEGVTVNNLRYDNDTALTANSEREIQSLLNIVIEESEKKGLNLNIKKTVVMFILKAKTPPPKVHYTSKMHKIKPN